MFLLTILLLASETYSYPSLRMPVMGGDTMKCDQGNSYNYTHKVGSKLQYAWDFSLKSSSGDGDLGYPVVASADGKIIYAQNYNSSVQDAWGNCVVIDYFNDQANHNGLYAHLQKIFVKSGETVKQGQVIGLMGKGDGQYASHLHYQTQTGSDPNGQSVFSSFWDVSTPQTGGWYVSKNSGVFDREFSTNGGSTKFGTYQNSTGTYKGIHWWHGWKANDLFGTQNTARRCYIQDYNGGQWGACAIVYDALGGARKAYTVRTGFWNVWASQGGPQGPLGMPVSNEYPNGSNRARQEFQRGYLFFNGSTGQISVNVYPKCAPGMTSSGWNQLMSYKMARAYELHGARNSLGEPSSYMYKVSGQDVWAQEFNGGSITIVINEATAVFKVNFVEEAGDILPSTFTLHQNYPNPFNPTTTISYSIPSATHVRLDIFNILGQRVQTLVDEHQSAGEHSVLWNSTGFSSGIYLYRFSTPEAVETKKMVLVR